MTTLAAGSSVTVAVRDGGTVAVATNGGMASAVVTPTEGNVHTVSFGPLAERRTLGPYKEGASIVITNSSCGAFDYDVESMFDPSSVAITGGTIADGVTINTGLTPTTLNRAIARMRVGNNDIRILLVGDSTTWGTGATVATTSVAPLVATRLAAMTGLPVYANLFCPPSPTASAADSRVTVGASWGTNGGTYGFGSNAVWQNPGSGGSLTFTYNQFSNKVRIYYLQNSGLGTLTTTINTVAQTAQSTVGAAQVNYVEYTFTRTNANTVVIAPSVNTVFVLGVEFFDTTQKCIYIGSAGVPSSTSGDWNQTGTWKARQMISMFAPDHSIISLGINDAAGSVSASTYLSNITAIAGQCASTGTVDLCTFYSADTALGRLPFETAYLSALSGLATSAGYGLIDTRASLGEYAVASAGNLMSDQIHPNAFGYSMAARWITRRLERAAN